MTNAYEQNVISQQIFTADLQKGAPGSFDFGFVDSSKYTGQIYYVPVDNSSGFWGLTASGYQVGDNSFNYTPVKAIVDTGTTLMAMDSTLVSNYWSTVSGATYDSNQGGYTFPCDAQLPDLQIGLGDYSATVPGSYLNFAPVDASTCFGGLQGNTNIGFSILGDVFIKSQFVVFDADSLQIGFAAKDLSGSASVTSITPNSTAVSASPSDAPNAAPTTYYSGTTLTISRPTYTTVITIPALSTITSDLPTAAPTTYYNGTTLSISVPSYSTVITVPTVTAASATVLAENGTATLQYTSATSTPYDDGLWHTTYYQSVTVTADAATATSTSETATDALLSSSAALDASSPIASLSSQTPVADASTTSSTVSVSEAASAAATTSTASLTATDASSTLSSSDTTTPASVVANATTAASEIVTTITVSALSTQITLTITSSPAALPSVTDLSTAPTDTLATTIASGVDVSSSAVSAVNSASATATDSAPTVLTTSYPTLQPTSTGSSTSATDATAPLSAASYAPSNFAYSTIPDQENNSSNEIDGSAESLQRRGIFKNF